MKGGYEMPNAQGEKHWTHRKPESVPRGTLRYNSKLTDADVRLMRRMREKHTYAVLAACFNVSRKAAWEICTRRKWRHVA